MSWPDISKVLMVMAHPDDEVIFGWPVFFGDFERKLLICSSDENNPKRQWCAHRKNALKEVCEREGVEFECLPYDSAFFSITGRGGKLAAFCDDVASRLEGNHDVVFTHNPVGEYGHADHKLLFDIVISRSQKPVWYTDICVDSGWPGDGNIPKRMWSMWYRRQRLVPEPRAVSLDLARYRACEEIYRRHGVWTWSKPPVIACKMHESV